MSLNRQTNTRTEQMGKQAAESDKGTYANATNPPGSKPGKSGDKKPVVPIGGLQATTTVGPGAVGGVLYTLGAALIVTVWNGTVNSSNTGNENYPGPWCTYPLNQTT